MKKLFVLLAAASAMLCALSSCSVYESLEPAANKEWVGKTHAAIIQAYGAPDRETSDGAGGKILVYENYRTEVRATAEPGPWYGGIYGFYYDIVEPVRNINTTSETKVDYAHFYIGTDNLCYKVATNLEREVKKFK